MTTLNDPEKKLMQTIVRYSLSHYFRQFLSIFTAFIRPRLLSPELFGLWNLLKVIQTYGSYLHLGSRSAMRYQVPFFLAANDHDRVDAIKASTFWGSLAFHILATGLIVGTAVFGEFSRIETVGLLAFSLILLLQWYYEYHLALLKAYQRFSLISSSNYFYYALMFVLTIVFIAIFGIYGAFVSVILSLAAVIAFILYNVPKQAPGSFNLSVFTDLARFGGPIMLFNLISVFIRTSDRFIVAAMLGNEALGFYSIATMILGFLMNIPGVAREVMEPQLMEKISDGFSERLVTRHLIAPLIQTAFLVPFLIGSAIYLLPVFVGWILPGYQAGIVPAQILVAGGYFLALSFTVRGIIIANRWQMQASLVMAASLVCNVFFSIVLIRAGWQLQGVALASALSFFILFASQCVFICKKSRDLARQLKPVIPLLFYPFATMCFIFLLLEILDRSIPENIVAAAACKLAVFYGAGAVLLVLTRRRHNMLDMIRRQKK